MILCSLFVLKLPALPGASFIGATRTELTDTTTIINASEIPNNAKYVMFRTADTVTNVQLEIGTTVTDYVEHYKSNKELTDETETKADKSVEKTVADNWKNGINIITYPYFNDLPYTTQGITMSDNGDGGVVFNGTSTGYTRGWVNYKGLLKAGTYAIGGSPKKEKFGIRIYNADTSTNIIDADAGAIKTFTLDTDTNVWIYNRIASAGIVADNDIFYPFLYKVNEDGSYPTEYQRYAKGNVELTEEIAQKEQELTDLKMLGWTVPRDFEIQNYVDENGIYHQKVGRLEIGKINFTYDATNLRFMTANLVDLGYKDIKNAYSSRISKIYCNRYEAKSKGESFDKTWDDVIYVSANLLFIHDHDYDDTTLANFQSSLNGLYMYYELSTEITKSVDGNECTSNNVKTLTIPTDNFNIYLVKQGNLKQIRVYEATQKTFASANWVELGTYPEFACVDNGVSVYVQVPLFDVDGKQFASIQFNKNGLVRLRLSATTNGWLQTSATYL